jgi:uncharacterized OB-fold protein
MPAFAIARDDATAAFLDATKRGEFLIVRDTRTGELLSPQFDVTIEPGRYEYVPAAGTGTVVSWAVVHQRGAGRLPVGIVELDEGPWWWASFPEADPDADLYGVRVKVAFELMGDREAAEAIPYFRVL